MSERKSVAYTRIPHLPAYGLRGTIYYTGLYIKYHTLLQTETKQSEAVQKFLEVESKIQPLVEALFISLLDLIEEKGTQPKMIELCMKAFEQLEPDFMKEVQTTALAGRKPDDFEGQAAVHEAVIAELMALLARHAAALAITYTQPQADAKRTCYIPTPFLREANRIPFTDSVTQMYSAEAQLLWIEFFGRVTQSTTVKALADKLQSALTILGWKNIGWFKGLLICGTGLTDALGCRLSAMGKRHYKEEREGILNKLYTFKHKGVLGEDVCELTHTFPNKYTLIGPERTEKDVLFDSLIIDMISSFTCGFTYPHDVNVTCAHFDTLMNRFGLLHELCFKLSSICDRNISPQLWYMAGCPLFTKDVAIAVLDRNPLTTAVVRNSSRPFSEAHFAISFLEKDDVRHVTVANGPRGYWVTTLENPKLYASIGDLLMNEFPFEDIKQMTDQEFWWKEYDKNRWVCPFSKDVKHTKLRPIGLGNVYTNRTPAHPADKAAFLTLARGK